MARSRLATFWENEVKEGWKHIVTHTPGPKAQRHRTDFAVNALQHVVLGPDSTVLDWGCGGGLLSKEILLHTACRDIVLVDISQQSIDAAQSYIGMPCESFVLHAGPQVHMSRPVDLLVCYSVIQHFPSKKYWDTISRIWVDLEPKSIALRTKIAERTTEADEYYVGTQFLNGLLLSVADLKAPFADKYNVSHEKEIVLPTGPRAIFLLFHRKDI